MISWLRDQPMENVRQRLLPLPTRRRYHRQSRRRGFLSQHPLRQQRLSRASPSRQERLLRRSPICPLSPPLSPQRWNRNRRRGPLRRGRRRLPRSPFCLLSPNRGQAGKCRQWVCRRPTSLHGRLSLRLRQRRKRRQTHRRRPLSSRQSAHQPTKGSRQVPALFHPPRRCQAKAGSTQHQFVMSRRDLRSRHCGEHRVRRPNRRLRHRRSVRAWIRGPPHRKSRAV